MKTFKINIKWIKKCIKISKKYFIYNFIDMVIQVFFNIFDVFLLKIILDCLLDGNFRLLCILVCFIFILNSILQYISNKISYVILPIEKSKITETILLEIYITSLNKELSDFDNNKLYEDYYFILNEGAKYVETLYETYFILIKQILSLIFLTGLVLFYDLLILIGIIICVFLISILNFLISKLNFKNSIEMNEVDREIDYVQRVMYLREYAMELRIYNIFDKISKIFQSRYAMKRSIEKKNGNKLLYISSLQNIFQLFFQGSIIIYLGYNTVKKIISSSDFVVLFNSVLEIENQMTLILHFIPRLYECSLYLGKIDEFLYDKKCKLDKGKVNIVDILELKNVYFKYESSEKYNLQNINLYLRRGNKVAFVGENGAGKSTLAKLICGLYEPSRGNINFSSNCLKSNSSIVFQDFQVYALSILDNIYCDEISDRVHVEKIVWNALKKVGLYEKVMQLDNKLDTILSTEFNDNGTKFSMGELQKMVLARAIVKESSIIILDEPSSFFDGYAQRELFKIFDLISKDKILIIITHNLAYMKGMDYIYFIDNGKIIEEGTHDQLIRKGANYTKLYNSTKDMEVSNGSK